MTNRILTGLALFVIVAFLFVGTTSAQNHRHGGGYPGGGGYHSGGHHSGGYPGGGNHGHGYQGGGYHNRNHGGYYGGGHHGGYRSGHQGGGHHNSYGRHGHSNWSPVIVIPRTPNCRW